MRFIAMLGALVLFASSARTQEPTFEVASIKRNTSGVDRTSTAVQPGGRFVATNVTLRMLVKTAYGLHDTQVIGGPGWIDTERFDIHAKAADGFPTNVFREQSRLMLRSLLADRFRAVVRQEMREIPVYAIVLARRDGALGPQLRRSKGDDCGDPKSLPIGADLPEPSPALPCGAGFARMSHLAGRHTQLSTLITGLSNWADRVVLDQTSLNGTFDWDLQWTPTPSNNAAGGVDPNALPLVTAIQEQLGLKLEGQRAAMNVVVIDRAERPAPD